MNLKTLIHKIVKRARRTTRTVFIKHIKYNQRYKPLGIKSLVLNQSGVVQLIELNPPYTSTLDLRPEFITDCSSFIKPIVSIQYPGDYFATMKDARVYCYDVCNRAVISNDNYLIEQASFQWRDDVLLEGKDNLVFKVMGFHKPKKYRGRVFSLLSNGSAKYYFYHWVFDTMAKLHFLKESGQFDQVDYFLVPNYQYKYHKEYLAHFGILENKVINEEVEHHIQADLLMICSEIRIEDHHPKKACDFLYHSFINATERKKNDKSIYIARGDADKNRKVVNEPQLIDMLKGYGFEIHYLSKISVEEQARLFNSANIVIGVHGGGLSNLVYCEPGTKVLEIFPDQYVRHLYYDLSNKRTLVYDYLLCKSEGSANNLTEGLLLGLEVDLDAIKFKVNAMLAPNTIPTG